MNNQDITYKIYLDPDQVISELFDSFNHTEEPFLITVTKQLLLDLPRMDIYYQHKLINNLEDFVEKIRLYMLVSYPNSELSFREIILMMANQAPFYYPFDLIHSIYGKQKNDYYLISGKDRPRVDIYLRDNVLHFKFRKSMILFNIDEGKIICQFQTRFVIKMSLINEKTKMYVSWRVNNCE